MRFADAVRYLTQRPDLERGIPGSTLSLAGIRALLGALGRPDQRYPSVLIAGTKGKGSTAAMIERSLRSAGYRTGLYTQPDLHTIRERVRIDGQPISAEDFSDGIEVVRAATERATATSTYTTYELMTAAALDRFSRHAVDVAVIEVGLGGRMDATNAVAASVSALTSISLDHTQILGNTVAAIAREKADIIKQGQPIVSAPQPPEALAVIREMAAERGARLIVADDGARWQEFPSDHWNLITGAGRLDDVRLSLRGGFQRINAAVATTALLALPEVAGFSLELGAIRTGLEDTDWPGRFEMVAIDPLIIVDGAHNVESAQRLREALAEELPGRRPIYVLGIAADKDIGGIVRALCSPSTGARTAPAPRLVIATASRHPRAAAAETIATAVRETGTETTVAETLHNAIRQARREAAVEGVVLVTGSLHLVAEAREHLGLAEPSGEQAFDPWATP